MDVRLVSFPLSPVRNDLAQTEIRRGPALPRRAVATLRSTEWRDNRRWLRQLLQGSLQLDEFC
jgi:hypothetical protein